jgi:transposase InsO family protein
VRFAWIAVEKAGFPVSVLCRCLDVTRSGYYAWATRGASVRAQVDQQLTRQLRVAHADSRGTYGRPRLHRVLRARGLRVSAKRIARLMQAAHLVARGRRRYRVTTDSAHAYPIAPNRLQRRFRVTRLNAVWAADITACPTRGGWCYLAVILDLASRRVVGWALQRTLDSTVVTTALTRALLSRRPTPPLLHHSDRGCQYASGAYRQQLADAGIRASMSRVGNCWDNAPVESFFSTLKTELLPARPWPDIQAAHAAIRDYIDDFYNRRRLHSSLGYVSPAAFEAILEATS